MTNPRNRKEKEKERSLSWKVIKWEEGFKAERKPVRKEAPKEGCTGEGRETSESNLQ